MEPIQSRVEAVLSQMTPEEKAGQLTQFFFFNLPQNAETPPGFDLSGQPQMVEAMLGQSGVGSLLFVTNPAENNRLQRLAIEGTNTSGCSMRWRSSTSTSATAQLPARSAN
jgi:beta-glucosidase